MRILLVLAAAAGAIATLPTAVSAQEVLTGDELRGHTVDVLFADGNRNAVYFGADGSASITSPAGLRSNARWSANAGQLCLNVSGTSECWDYTRRFSAGQTVSLNSSCDETSQWTARSVNPAVQQTAPAIIRGERG